MHDGNNDSNSDGDTLVVRSEFSATDTDTAEEFLYGAYTTSKLTITGVPDEFTFAHAAVIAPGFSINRMQVGVDMIGDAVAAGDDPLTVIQPAGGRFAYVGSAYPDVHTDTGDVVLLPPTGPARGICERFDLAMVALDRSAISAYAATTTGLDPDGLIFDHITPRTPELGRLWSATVTRIRDDVLADPWASASPILVGQAFESLAAALLSVFPNSALARLTDPESPPVRGQVSPVRLREVVEFLDVHADRPIGPATIAELAGMPTVEIVEGLRRRGLHPAWLLWRARMRGVRRDLLDADPAPGQVRALAARWGFAHLGRFRVAYRREFDETPEQTEQR